MTNWASFLDAHVTERNVALTGFANEIAVYYPGNCIILYGSRVLGCDDSLSDIDVLVLASDQYAPVRHEIRKLPECEADITIAGVETIARSLSAPTVQNNNWFLNALRDSQVHFDVNREGTYLATYARNLKAPVMSHSEREACCRGLEKLLRSASRLVDRAELSEEAHKIAEIRVDRFVVSAIYAHFCLKSEWTMSFQRLMPQCKREFPRLYAVWSRYFCAKDLHESLLVAYELMELINFAALNCEI
jgi:hypothetical protein